MDKIGQYEIYDVYDFISINSKLNKYWFYISCIIFFVLIIVILLPFFLKKLKKKNLPEVFALNKLKKLKEEVKKNDNNYDKFYFELTTILKKYINEKFGINVISATDFETIKIIDSTELKNYFSEFMVPILQNANLIKFSKLKVNKNQVINDLEKLEKFILLTSDSHNKK